MLRSPAVRAKACSFFLLALAAAAGCGEGPGTGPGGSGGGTGTGTPDDPYVLVEGVTTESDPAAVLAWFEVDLVGAGPHVLLIEGGSYSTAIEITASLDLAAEAVASCSPLGSPEVCELDLAPGRYYVRVATYLSSGVGGVALTYLDLAPTTSADAPEALEVDAEPVWTSVVDGAPSYYTFVVAEAGSYLYEYDEITGAYADPTVTLHANADFGAAPIVTCADNYLPVRCPFVGLLPGTYGVRAEGSTGESSLGEVRVERGIAEGAVGADVPLAIGVPHAGGIDEWSRSFYEFTTDPSPAGSYRFTFDAPSEGHLVSVLRDDAERTHVATCDGITCQVGGLDASTTYYAIVFGNGPAEYTLTVTRGELEGSAAEPVPLPLDVPRELHIDPLGESHYVFTTTSSGTYELVYEYLDGSTVEPFATVFLDPALPYDITTDCDATRCLTEPLDADTTYSLRVATGPEATYQITLRRTAAGEGSMNDPVPLALGASHATTLSGDHPSYYSFTTGPTPPSMVAALARTPTGLRSSQLVPEPTKTCSLPMCIYTGLLPNTTYTVIFQGFAEASAVVRLIDLDVDQGCDGGGLACLDFEGTPPTTTAPGYSVDDWTVTSAHAATGAASFVSGGATGYGERSCFTYTVPGVSQLAWFSVRGDVAPEYRLTVISSAGAETSIVAPGATGAWTRAMAHADPMADQQWTICYTELSSNPGYEIWIDDVQFE